MSDDRYRLIESNSPHGLMHDVNALIRDGWEPCGGVGCMYLKHNRLYCQAVWKPERVSNVTVQTDAISDEELEMYRRVEEWSDSAERFKP